MVRRNNLYANIDWISILLWIVIMAFGWMNIYSANIMEADSGVFDFSQRFGKQLIWIGASIVLAVLLFVLDAKFYIYFSYLLYAILILILMGVLVFGKEINGARSWFVIGGFQFQPSEFAKPLTALALARILTSHNFELRKFRHLAQSRSHILIPPALIMLQPDLGSTLVYFAFVFVLFREGFSANIMLMLAALMFLVLCHPADGQSTDPAAYSGDWSDYLHVCGPIREKERYQCLAGLQVIFGVLFGMNYLFDIGFSLFIIGLFTVIPSAIVLLVKGLNDRKYSHLKILAGVVIAIVFIVSVDYAMNNILKPHQQHRIYVTLGIEDDPQGVGYNVNQSKIAIGSGGFSGKGYLNGTQTKLHFVPEQSTDFIFCTVGEEWGFSGNHFCDSVICGFDSQDDRAWPKDNDLRSAGYLDMGLSRSCLPIF